MVETNCFLWTSKDMGDTSENVRLNDPGFYLDRSLQEHLNQRGLEVLGRAGLRAVAEVSEEAREVHLEAGEVIEEVVVVVAAHLEGVPALGGLALEVVEEGEDSAVASQGVEDGVEGRVLLARGVGDIMHIIRLPIPILSASE